MGQVFADIKLACKLLTKHTTLKIAVIVTLALGIGANTAMFTVLDALLFPALPYSHSKDLVIFRAPLKNGEKVEATSYPVFEEWRMSSRSFEEVAAESLQNMILSGQGPARVLKTELVNADFFPALRVNASLGRTFTNDETAVGETNPVVILSNGLWKTSFGADKDIVGKTVHLNDHAFTIIGVMPPDFQGISQRAEAWIPITMIGSVSTPALLQNRLATWVTVIGRLKPGITMQAAQQEINTITKHAAPDNKDWHDFDLKPVEARNLERYKKEAYVLFGAVIFVLLIASLNVANLLLSYFSDRKSELAVRNALGAPRARLFQQLVTESVVLASMGGGLGLLLAIIAVKSMGRGISSVLVGIRPLALNGRIFALTAAISVLTGIVSALIPLFQLVTQEMSDHLKNQSRTGTGLAHTRLRTVLVIGQISLAIVLMVGAGLLLQSILRLRNVDMGFRAEGILVVRLTALPTGRYDSGQKMADFYERLLEKITNLPSVRSAGFSTNPPLLTPSPSVPFLIRGRSDMSPNHPPTAQYVIVSRGYFATLSIPIIQGREVERSDSAATEPVVLINEAMSKQYWPNGRPVGQYLNIFDGAEAPKRIIGVVGNFRDSAVDTASSPEMYVPDTQVPSGFISLLRSFPPALLVQGVGSLDPLANSVRALVAEIDPSEAVLSTPSLQAIVYESVAQPRLYSQVLGLFAAIALVLAALGIYGVVSYSVTQRTRELGVRMALGATRKEILLLVLGQSMFFTMLGVMVGVGGALALTGLLRSLLFEIHPYDPGTLLVAALLLSAVAFMAAYLPARRASLIDPNNALRV